MYMQCYKVCHFFYCHKILSSLNRLPRPSQFSCGYPVQACHIGRSSFHSSAAGNWMSATIRQLFKIGRAADSKSWNQCSADNLIRQLTLSAPKQHQKNTNTRTQSWHDKTCDNINLPPPVLPSWRAFRCESKPSPSVENSWPPSLGRTDLLHKPLRRTSRPQLPDTSQHPLDSPATRLVFTYPPASVRGSH